MCPHTSVSLHSPNEDGLPLEANKYTSYAVHIYPDNGSLTTPASIGYLDSNGSFPKHNSNEFLKNKQVDSFNLTTSISPLNTLSKPAWTVHPSLEALLGDLCFDLDLHEPKLSHPSTEGSLVEISDTKGNVSPVHSTLSHKLSVCAPEFVPSFPKAKLLLHKANVDANPSAIDQGSKLTYTWPETAPLLLEPAKDEHHPTQTEEHTSLSSIMGSYFQEQPQIDHCSLNISEECSSSARQISPSYGQPLISFDDVQSFKEPNAFTLQHCIVPTSHPEREKVRRAASSEHLQSDTFETHFLPCSREENKSHKVVKDAEHSKRGQHVSVEETEGKRPPTTFERPVFKTYAEAANFYYSLLEEQTRENLFKCSSPSSIVIPNQDPDENMQQSRHTNRPNHDRSLYLDARVVHEELAVLHEHNVADIPKPICLSPIRQEQPSPQNLSQNDCGERRRYCSGAHDIPETNNSFYDSPRSVGAYSSSDKGDRNENSMKSYHPTNVFPSRFATSTHRLEREIDEYHENLRAKANRVSPNQSHRIKEGGSWRTSRRRRFSKEEEGFDDPVSVGGEVGWEMEAPTWD